MFGDDQAQARKLFKEYLEEPGMDDGNALEQSRAKSIPDDEAIAIIKSAGSIGSCNLLAQAGKQERDRVVALLKDNGLTVRQISRLTGINRGIVQMARTSDMG